MLFRQWCNGLFIINIIIYFQDTVLEILVASGADLDSRTNNSETPLGTYIYLTYTQLNIVARYNSLNSPLNHYGAMQKRWAN